jgi:tetratricopeptide (TPR) repeat protein
LFLHSAHRVSPDFALRPDNLLSLVDICSLVEGMPLGIELAAAWVAVLEPDEIVAEIERNLDILATDAANVPERQQSLRAVFDASWQLLTEQERRAVQRLAVFQDGFDREGAQQAGQVSLVTLLALVNKSWLQQAAGGRFQIHELLRRYGQEKLARDPARDPALEAAVRDRHSRYYCDWLKQQEEGTWGAQQQAVLAAIEGDIGNVYTACKWAARQGSFGRLGGAVNALGLFYHQWRGRYRAGERIMRELAESLAAVEGWPASATASAQRTMVRILGWHSCFCELVGELQRASRLLEEGLALLDGPTLAGEDTRFERAHIALQSGYLVLYSDPATARQRFAESLDLYREIDYRWGIASARMGLGRALRGLNALQDAREAMTSSLALYRELGDGHGESEALATLGGLILREARFEQAERLIQQSLSIIPESDRSGIALGLAMLGSARLHTGQFAEAEAVLSECVALSEELGMRSYQLLWSTRLGTAYLHAGRYRAARTQAELIVSRAQELAYDRLPGMGLVLLGEVALVEADFAQAHQHLEDSRDALRPAASGPRGPGQLAMLGLAARGLDRPAEARQHLVSALDQGRKTQDFMEVMVALAGTALLLADEGEAERAVELYALASRYPFVVNSRWFDDVIGGQIAAVAATLPPEALHAARELGRARDLDATIEELLGERAG